MRQAFACALLLAGPGLIWTSGGSARVTDATPVVSIGDAAIVEGNDGLATVTFPLTLSAPAPAGGATVDFATRAGSAAAVVDFKTKSGTATFAAGQTSANVGVRVVGDTTSEGNEQFYVDLTNPSAAVIGRASGTGTIVDDEGDASGLSLGNAKIVEGDSGTRLAAFTIRLSEASASTVTVDYATSDGSATQPADYTAKSGTATIPAGAVSALVTVLVAGDTLAEGDETFSLTLSNAVGAAIVGASATATIADDDDAATHVPGAPVLSAKRTAGVAGLLTLAWSEPSGRGSLISSYNLEISFNGGADWGSAGSYQQRTATISCGSPSVTCTFRVTATNNVGTGPYSNVASATTYGVPGAPNVTAKRGPGASNITISWSKPATDGLPVTTFNCEISYNAGTNWSGCGSYPGSQQKVTIGCGTPTVTCWFRMTASDDAGTGPYGNTASATTFGVPGAPSVSAKRGPGASNVTISWSKPATDGLPVTSFNCEISYNAGTNWSGCGSYPSPQSSQVLGCGTPKVTCWFRMTASDDAGTGDYGNTASATTYDRPSPPTVSAHSGPDYGDVTLSWNTPATDGLPVTGFNCEISYNGGANWGSCSTYPKTQHSVVLGVGEAQPVLLRGTSSNDAGTSDYGNTVGATGRCCRPH